MKINYEHSLGGLSPVNGRKTGMFLNLGPVCRIGYGYDEKGRLESVSWNEGVNNVRTATYGYLPGSDLLETLATDNGYSVAHEYEPRRDLRKRIGNEFGGTRISQYDYEFDAVGRVVSEEKRGTAVNRALSERVLNADWFKNAESTGTGTEITPDYREYEYDNIGNRKTSVAWKDGALDTILYNSNPLNQYDRTETSAGVENTFSYDDDGNLTGITGEKNVEYGYNAENRLISAQPSDPVPGDVRTTFAYDYMGRRVKKTAGP